MLQCIYVHVDLSIFHGTLRPEDHLWMLYPHLATLCS